MAKGAVPMGRPPLCAHAQQLGFLPWFADLPLRERRLRARLLMVTPCVRMPRRIRQDGNNESFCHRVDTD